LYVFLPSWPIDRLRRSGLLPSRKSGGQPGSAKSSFPRKQEAGASDEGSPRTPAGAGAATEHDEISFATVIAAGGRQLLAAVNPAAAAKGLAPNLPLADALSFLPGLVTCPAELAEDAAALHRLAEWCGRFSPWTAPDSPDGVKIEITGSAHLWGGEAALAADLSARLARQNIGHRLAIADTLGAAWAIARFAPTGQAGGLKAHGDGTPAIVPPEGMREALAPLPAAALRLDPAVIQGLHRVGLRHVGDIMAMPRDALARRFGEAVCRRVDQALGDLPEPLSPLGEVPTRRVRLSFAEPIADPADLARAAERLTQDLVTRLAREGMGARRLGLGFHRVDGRVEHIRIGTARPSRDPAHLAKLLTGKLDTIDPGLGIEDVILAAFAVEKLAPEQIESPLLTKSPHPPKENPRPPAGGEGRVRGAGTQSALSTPLTPALSPRKRVEREDYLADETHCGGLGPLFDRIGARLGLAALARLEPRASHLPERASVAISVSDGDGPKKPPLPPLGEEGRVRGAAAIECHTHPPIADAMGPSLSRLAGEGAKPPRPVRLFAPPEPVEAFWVLPDDPPFQFTWRRRPHRVAQADGPERIAEEWWRPDSQLPDGAGDPDAIRDYYRVEDEAGRRFWLFRAGLPGDPPPRWFVHGIFA
jgi:protein ImuB